MSNKQSMEEIGAKIKQITMEQLGLNPKEYAEHVSFKNLGADSLDEIELTMGLEDEFGFEIPDAEANEHRSPAGMMIYVYGRLNPSPDSVSLSSGQTLGHVDG